MKDYKTLYENALERVKDFTERQNPPMLDKEIMHQIFPELRKSEDEKIIRTLREIVNWGCAKNISVENNVELKDCLAWLEKQGEQKTDDKVEPKFKVGDWITDGEYTWNVTSIEPLDYIIKSQIGDETDDNISYVDEHFHLWTIQDSKDGDVLALNGEVFIYAHRKQLYSIAVAHCFIDSDGGFYFDGEFGYTEKGNSIHPATKEQRDLLFQKMKEAGYEWDAEKKELKKIEQKPTPKFKIGDTIHRIGENTVFPMTIEKIEDGYYVCNNSNSFVNIKFQDYFELVEQKPAWSEKEEKIRKAILELVKQSSAILSPMNQKSMIAWLESIKDRVQPQPKQEWSEEDKKMLDSIIDCIDGLVFIDSDQLNWLKSIKPNHWKPSEEQMDALKFVVDYFGELTEYFAEYNEIESLYNNLKGLNLC